MESFKLGDIVSFDVEGVKPIDGKPYGYGRIIFVGRNGEYRFIPDSPVPPNLKMTNIQLVGQKKAA